MTESGCEKLLGAAVVDGVATAKQVFDLADTQSADVVSTPRHQTPQAPEVHAGAKKEGRVHVG